MIALIYRLKSGRVHLVLKDDKAKFSKDFKSVSEAQETMHKVSSDWELVQDIKIYQLNQKLKEKTNGKCIISNL